jgi:hypothetical protein
MTADLGRFATKAWRVYGHLVAAGGDYSLICDGRAIDL